MSYKGKFDPSLLKNPQRVIGDINNLIWRSLWERQLIVWLDEHPRVVRWGLEQLVIKYMRPPNVSLNPNKVAKYYIDFYIEYVDGERLAVEVKPKHECTAPVLGEGKRMSKGFKNKLDTFAVNQAKWAVASRVCEENGIKFYTWHEGTLDKLGVRMVKSVREDMPLNDLKQLTNENKSWRRKPSSAAKKKRPKTRRRKRPASARRRK